MMTMDTLPTAVQRAPRSLRARLLRCVVLSVIFLAGGVAGYCVGTMQLLDSPLPSVVGEKDKFTEFLLAHLKKDLSLTEAQYPQVERIVLQHHAAFDEIRKTVQPLYAKEMAS